MDVKALKQQACEAIDQRREEIIAIGTEIFRNPELGYKEFKTAQLVTSKLKEMGLSPREGIAVTGVRAELKGKDSKVRLAIMGELDAVVCPEHPHADPVTTKKAITLANSWGAPRNKVKRMLPAIRANK